MGICSLPAEFEVVVAGEAADEAIEGDAGEVVGTANVGDVDGLGGDDCCTATAGEGDGKGCVASNLRTTAFAAANCLSVEPALVKFFSSLEGGVHLAIASAAETPDATFLLESGSARPWTKHRAWEVMHGRAQPTPRSWIMPKATIRCCS